LMLVWCCSKAALFSCQAYRMGFIVIKHRIGFILFSYRS
jgi:hypothetical protein